MSHSLNDTHDAGYLIYLESKDATILRDNGATAFFFLNKVISPSDPSMNLMVGVVDCEIPVSFYNINNNNNKITINTHEIILPLQNYSAFNIQDDINAQLLIASIPVSVDFSQQSNKFTFSPSSVGATIVINGGTLSKYLGLVDSQLNNVASTSPIIGENCCNLAGTSNIYISSNFNINSINSTGQYSGILAKIQTDAPSSSYIFYQPSPVSLHVVSNISTSSIVISLLDDERNPVDLNGLFFSLTLSIEYSYKREGRNYGKFLLGENNENNKNNKNNKNNENNENNDNDKSEIADL